MGLILRAVFIFVLFRGNAFEYYLVPGRSRNAIKSQSIDNNCRLARVFVFVFAFLPCEEAFKMQFRLFASVVCDCNCPLRRFQFSCGSHKMSLRWWVGDKTCGLKEKEGWRTEPPAFQCCKPIEMASRAQCISRECERWVCVYF